MSEDTNVLDDVAVEPEFADDDSFVANGIRVGPGEGYLVPPLSPKAMSDIALDKPLDEETKKALAAVARRNVKTLGVTHGIDPNNLSEAGWGVVFLQNDPDAEPMCEALSPLLNWRQEQCGDLYRKYVAERGIPADSNGWTFLAGLGSGTGQPVDPKIVSYYLTIVAPPTQVSFDAQCAMDTQNAVGRLWFDGESLQARCDALERYANAIVTREKAKTPSPKRAFFFAARNKGDKATNRSAKFLAAPVSKAFTGRHVDWTVATKIGEEAKKKALLETLGGVDAPALLVTATHGAGLDMGDVRQVEHQGALVCQDWQGLASTGLTEDEYVAARDVAAADLPGTIAFLFACYGAGTPQFDAYLPQEVVVQQQIAAAPFVARLPQKLLLSGAAAVIGHVERAWTCSFQWMGAGAQTQVFKSLFDSIAAGSTVGEAMEFFDARCGAISQQLIHETTQRKWGKKNDFDIGALWTAQMDARNYIVLGDPAARLTI